MRNSLTGNLLLLCVLAHAGQSRAQENPSSSPPPSIASTSGNETELLRRLVLVRAKTVYLAVRLEPEAREGPKTPERREKLALEWLDLAVYGETRLKVVKSRKDADLTFLLLVGNDAARDIHVVSKEKLLVLPAALPMEIFGLFGKAIGMKVKSATMGLPIAPWRNSERPSKTSRLKC